MDVLRHYERGALAALDHITDERPDLEDVTMRAAEKIGADIEAMKRDPSTTPGAVSAEERWTIHNPGYEGGIVSVDGPIVNETVEVVPLARAEAAEQERDRLREALEWIYAEPEDALKVQRRAREALDARE